MLGQAALVAVYAVVDYPGHEQGEKELAHGLDADEQGRLYRVLLEAADVYREFFQHCAPSFAARARRFSVMRPKYAETERSSSSVKPLYIASSTSVNTST